jgi:hypothetical protein
MAGALVCSSASSAANSGGSRSGTVANIWAAFISGPFSPPRAALKALALRASALSPPNRLLAP